MGKKETEMFLEQRLFHETMLGVLDKSKQNFARSDSGIYESDLMNDLWWVWYEARNYTKYEIEEKLKADKHD